MTTISKNDKDIVITVGLSGITYVVTKKPILSIGVGLVYWLIK